MRNSSRSGSRALIVFPFLVAEEERDVAYSACRQERRRSRGWLRWSGNGIQADRLRGVGQEPTSIVVVWTASTADDATETGRARVDVLEHPALRAAMLEHDAVGARALSRRHEDRNLVPPPKSRRASRLRLERVTGQEIGTQGRFTDLELNSKSRSEDEPRACPDDHPAAHATSGDVAAQRRSAASAWAECLNS